MKRHLIIRLIALMLMMPLTAMARDYSATFDRTDVSQTISLLRKATGYDFVYQKQLLNGRNLQVVGNFDNVTLEQLLDYTVKMQMGLDYKIVDKTVTLSEPAPNAVGDQPVAHGVVLDEEGDPLPGATISIKGTNFATSSNIDGQFSISIPSSGADLEVSYVGMHPANVHVTKVIAMQSLKIVLSQSATIMDEVVVTGYQNIKRENATGAYTIISGDEINKRHNADVASSLEGNIPGLVKNRKNQYTEGEDNLVIRGVGTFQASSAPLIVVDGLPIEGGIESVNNYDIKSITVLKDASAAAIYGARASNGVIVITTKQADREKLSVEFNADLSITGKTDWSQSGWATAAELIELERLEFNGMKENRADLFGALMGRYNNYDQRKSLSPVTRLLARNYLGEVNDSELNSTLDLWSKNNYRDEYQNAIERARVNQMYNLSLRNQGKILASSFTFNYADDNLGMKKESSRTMQFRYKGDLKAAKWLDLSFSVNVNNNSTRHNAIYSFDNINSFRPYQSMYNADGTRAHMEADVMLDNPVLSNPEFGLMDHSFNLLDEVGLNTAKQTSTNIRTYVHALFHLPVKGWNASVMYQHEDIQSQSETEYYSSSYHARDIYNRYTTGGVTKVWEKVPDVTIIDFLTNPGAYPGYSYTYENGNYYVTRPVDSYLPTVHHMPEGGILNTSDRHSIYYTFRAQTDFNRSFGKHDISVLAGIEYRQNKSNSNSSSYFGYDHQSLTNNNVYVDWDFVNGFGKQSILGSNCPPSGAYASFGIYETLHRFYSYYFTGSYTYDSRYSVFGSYRVDKADIFGTDPKFRGHPLWSVGASWNLHNEPFMQPLTWLDALKLRASYGLTGNIDSNAKSVMVARLTTNRFNGGLMGKVNEYPNDQLRWEKTSTWNWGLDFGFFGYRLTGSVDAYRKYGSDLLTDVALDVTAGHSEQLLNAGEMLNTGVEFQLNGRILPSRSRKQVGIDLGVTFGYNHNKVTKVYFHPRTGSEFRSMALKQGYPLNTVTGTDFAGYSTDDRGVTYGTWRGHDGEIHNTSLSNSAFTIDDCIYLGTATPVWTGGITPEIRYMGFTLSSMMQYYGGHYMNTDPRVWNTSIYVGETPASYLDFYNGVECAVPTGYLANTYDSKTINLASTDYRNYSRADYLKVRSVTLSYDFDRNLVRKIGVRDLRLRFQIDNVATWARNGRSWDPEASRYGGLPVSTPSTYTMSVMLNL